MQNQYSLMQREEEREMFALDVRLPDDEIQTLEDPYTLRQPTGYS